MNRIFVPIALAGMVGLAACASHPKESAPPPMTPPSTASTSGAQSTGTSTGTAIGGMQQPQAGPQSTYQNRVVYFDFNQSVVKPEYFSLLRAQADYLMAHPEAKVMLEGYCDERGTREYNIGLGARRAASVRKFLLLQGVSSDQIQTISYGEAYPADPAHDEAAWAKNRRVVFNFHPDQGRSGTQPGNP